MAKKEQNRLFMIDAVIHEIKVRLTYAVKS